jgi:outer membrane protein assembly factor BamB
MRFLALFLAVNAFGASDWPRFRGPNGSGVSPDRGLPTELGRDRSVVWKAKTPLGHSSPIVAQGRVWITGYEGDQRIVLCFDARRGDLLWRKSVTKARTEAPNPENGFTTPTPTTDGRSVFVFFPDFGLLALDLDGNERWRTPLGPYAGVQGIAVSPVYVEGNVVLLIDTPEEAFLAAFDAATGKQAWKVDRPIGFLGSYATPALYQPAGAPAQIVVSGAVELTGYQAKTGERLWWARGVTAAPASPPLIAGDSIYTMEPTGNGAPPFDQMLAQYDKNKNGKIELSEVSGGGTDEKIMHRLFSSVDKNSGNGDGVLTAEEWNHAFASVADSGGLVRTRLDGKGDVTKTHVLWRYGKGLPYLTGPLLYDHILYVIRSGGILATLNPDTGELLGQQRLKDAGGDYYASPVAGDGKIYFASKEGKISVVRAGAQWEKLTSADLNDTVVATPAIYESRVYLRTDQTLYCFGVPVKG